MEMGPRFKALSDGREARDSTNDPAYTGAVYPLHHSGFYTMYVHKCNILCNVLALYKHYANSAYTLLRDRPLTGMESRSDRILQRQ